MQHRQLSFLISFLLGLFFLTADAQRPVDFIYTSLEKTLEKAKAENKNIFVETFTRHCAPCKKLDKELKDPELSSYLNEHFINVKVNMNGAYAEDYQLAYGVVFLPTIIFLNTSGDVLWQLDRFANANELKSICNKIINPQVRHHTSTKPTVKKEIAKTTAVASSSPPVEKTSVSASYSKVKKTAVKKTTAKTNNQVVSKPTIPITKIPEEKVADEDDGTIVYVLGQGGDDLPPHVLRQESYFRLQLMDGSHKQTAKQYLATQEDLLSKINIRFLHDFLDDARSEEFEFMMANRDTFVSVLGKDVVTRTTNIIVNKELERAYPRPDIARATQLYTFLDKEDPQRSAEIYDLHSLYEAGESEQFLVKMETLEGKEYLEDHVLLYRYVSELLKADAPKRKLKKAKPLVTKIVALQPDNSQYQELLDSLMEKI